MTRENSREMDMVDGGGDSSSHSPIDGVRHPYANGGQDPGKPGKSVEYPNDPWWETLDRDHGGSIVFYRNQPKGLGDIVTILPAIQTVKMMLSQSRVSVQVQRQFHPLLAGHPDIYRVLDVDVASPRGRQIDLSTSCSEYETDALSRGVSPVLPRSSIFTRASGLPDLRLRPRLYPDSVAVRTMARVVKGQRTSVGLVLRSAERWKDYPWTRQLSCLLVKGGYEVYSIDQSRTLDVSGVTPIVGRSLLELVATVSLLDFVISPDTGALHVAEGVGTQGIGLFGSMGGRIRSDAYADGPSLRVIQTANCGSQPCFYDRCRGINEFQPCMIQLHPRRILHELRSLC